MFCSCIQNIQRYFLLMKFYSKYFAVFEVFRVLMKLYSNETCGHICPAHCSLAVYLSSCQTNISTFLHKKIFLPTRYFQSICLVAKQIYPNFDKNIFTNQIFSNFDKIFYPTTCFHVLTKYPYPKRWNINKSWRQLFYCLPSCNIFTN